MRRSRKKPETEAKSYEYVCGVPVRMVRARIDDYKGLRRMVTLEIMAVEADEVLNGRRKEGLAV